MATNTTDTYDQVGIREDLADSVWDVSPEEVPFSSNCSKVSVDNTYFEWQTDSLAAVSADTAVEGDDATFAPASPTTRLGNRTEILEKTAITSGTLEATNRAGRGKEMAYQVAKRVKEIKRDFEHHLVGIHQASVTGTATTARKTASVATWLATNFNDGPTGGAPPTGDGTDTPTDGTQRAFIEADLGDVIDQCWTSGGNPDVIMLNSFQKRALNAFAGAGGANQTVNREQGGKKIVNAVSVYESDYGQMKVVPNRFMRTREVLVLDTQYWAIGILRGMQNKEIAKTGDSYKRQVLMEAGLMAKNEASSGIVRDLTTS